MPTVVRGKVIGLFVADQNASGREITDNDFISTVLSAGEYGADLFNDARLVF